jgi:putative ABC transport system permease protein
MKFFTRFKHRTQRQRELDDEIRAHLAMATRERIERGESPAEAEANARREFGNATQVKEVTRDMWGWRWLETLLQNIRYSLRQLRHNPGFTAVAVLSLALGIGATTAVFSVMYALAFRRLAVQRPDQLVELDRAGRGNLHSYPEWKLFRDRQNIFSSVLAYNYSDTNFNIEDAKQQQELSGLYVSGDYFPGLGVPAVLGRVLEPSDDQPGAPPVCVLGYGLWRRLYGQSRDVLGRVILVNGHEFQIVGVLPRSFLGVTIGDMPEIFMPLEAERRYKDYQVQYGRQSPSLDSTATLLSFVGRLKPGVSVTQANAGLRVLAAQSRRAKNRYGRSFILGSLVALPMRNGISIPWLQDMDLVLLLMAMATVALVIACANLGNLLLARATKRQAEIATRLALGATRGRLVRQLLTESVALSVAGAAAGLLIARSGSRILLWALSFTGDPLLLDMSWDAKLVAFVVGITLSCALLFGLAPALRATGVSLYSAMSHGVTVGKRTDRVANSLLVVVQVGLSMALLVSAGLLVRTLHALLAVNPGYDPRGVLVAEATWQGPGESPQREAFVGRELLREFRSLPGVTVAGWARTFSSMTGLRLVAPGPRRSERRSTAYNIPISTDFFRSQRTPILAGRDFNDGDTGPSFPVAILSKELARTLFRGVNPVGLRFPEKDDPNQRGQGYPVEVVGVAGDIQYRDPNDAPLPLLFRPVSQCGALCSGVGDYQIRVAGELPEMARRLKNSAAIVDSHIVLKIWPLANMIDTSVHRNRAMAWIAIAFGLFVGLLAMIGVYGVTSYATAERTREIGIRMALGAQPRNVFRMILGETMGVVCIGVAFGVAGGLAAAQMIRGMLWGVSSTDPLSFAFAACLMLLIAGIAAFLPAQRAAKVDPMLALRYE